MARPPRIEFPDALYHVTSRGNRREPIFLDDSDRAAFLTLLADTCERFDAAVLAYCLMDNHYHLVLTTRTANLSRLMRHLGGVYTQRYNRRHSKVGHVFQGRFKAILVDGDAYLQAVCRYVDLNPVRAGMVTEPGDWPWSSYRAHTGKAPSPLWLDSDALHAMLLAGPLNAQPERGTDYPQDVQQRRLAAQQRYAASVDANRDAALWPDGLRQQVYLGDENFVQRMQRMQAQAGAVNLRDDQLPLNQQADPTTLEGWLAACDSRDQAVWMAHQRSGMTLTAIASELGLSLGRVSQLVLRAHQRASGAREG